MFLTTDRTYTSLTEDLTLHKLLRRFEDRGGETGLVILYAAGNALWRVEEHVSLREYRKPKSTKTGSRMSINVRLVLWRVLATGYHVPIYIVFVMKAHSRGMPLPYQSITPSHAHEVVRLP
jgi:hypothetical protein